MEKFLHISLLGLVLTLTGHGACFAEAWELELAGGSTSAAAGIHHIRYNGETYFHIGASGVYTDAGDTEYQLVSVDALLGNDTPVPGLSCNLGLFGLLANTE